MRIPIHVAPAAIALAAALCAPATARAQANDPEAEAQRLFLEGREAVERGDYATGCPRFAESLALIRRASTLLNLAQCEEHEGRLRSALDYWTQGAADLDPTDERMALARQRIADLEARIPRLTVRLASNAPAGVVVRVDGVPMPTEDLGQPLPMTTGAHEVVLLVPGQPEQRLPVDLAERDRKEIMLQVTPGEKTVLIAPTAAGAPPLDTRRTLGFVVGGIGLAGLTVAGITGMMVVSRDSHIEEQCPDKRCSPEGLQTIEGTKPLLVVNAVAWGLGLGGLGAGAWLLLTGNDRQPRATAVDAAPLPGGARITIRRSF